MLRMSEQRISVVPKNSPHPQMSAQSLAAISADAVTSVTPIISTTTVVPGEVVVPVTGIHQVIHKNAIWVFLIVAIIVLVILFWIAKPQQEWFAGLNNSWSWLKANNMSVMAIIMVIVVLLMAYVSYVAYVKTTARWRNGIILSFAASMLLLIVWFIVFYNTQNLMAASWLGVAVLVAGLIQTWYVFNADRAAGWGMVPYLLWLVTAVAFGFQLAGSNPLDV